MLLGRTSIIFPHNIDVHVVPEGIMQQLDGKRHVYVLLARPLKVRNKMNQEGRDRAHTLRVLFTLLTAPIHYTLMQVETNLFTSSRATQH